MEPRPDRLPRNPYVHVQPVTVHEGHVMFGQKPVDLLPSEALPRHLGMKIQAFLQIPGNTAFHLEWEGNSKVPRGARIGDKEVAYASGGFVTADTWGDDVIGRYDRIERENPTNPRLHEMVVYIEASERSDD